MQISKYSASGNDFIIFHTFEEKDRSKLAKELCHRQNGIGADGLIVLLPSCKKEYDFKWQFYNSDGSEASMCGNGSRATAHYAYKNGLCDKKMSFLTGAGIIEAEVDGDVVETTLTDTKIVKESISENGKNWDIYDTGVPHLVTFTDDLESYSKDEARKLRQKYNANVNYALIKDEKMYVRTYERGVEDETLACGTGMAACFYSAFKKGLVNDSVEVYPKSKERLNLAYKNNKIYFKGKVVKIFDIILY
ncbi:MAG: diaminopimelate epimerase [Epsilonproteobacteria bacterium]|nr:diaminopimelate epimerase [Campylobacterota bacterium]